MCFGGVLIDVDDYFFVMVLFVEECGEVFMGRRIYRGIEC